MTRLEITVKGGFTFKYLVTDWSYGNYWFVLNLPHEEGKPITTIIPRVDIVQVDVFID